MDDILEKITINIDSDYANFISDSEFYVDIIDDIKNCIYIKTLKTEVFVKSNVPDGSISQPTTDEVLYIENSIFDDSETKTVFNFGDYIYVTLNDLYRINTVSKKITPKTFSDIESNQNNNDFGFVWYKVEKTPQDFNFNNSSEVADNNFARFEIDLELNPNQELNDMYKSLFYKKLGIIIRNKATTSLQDKIFISKEELINSLREPDNEIVVPDEYIDKIKDLITQNTYYHNRASEDNIYRYVPTYIGYTYTGDKINKYTWEIINNNKSAIMDDLQLSEYANIKYLYNDKEGLLRNTVNKVYNYEIKKEEFNTLKYYDSIYINKPILHINKYRSPLEFTLSYKQELTGTSCGPNDTNTMVLNPILPELKRFNIKLWKINELGEHVEIPINKEEGVFRVIMSFTIYYKRKKVTRV